MLVLALASMAAGASAQQTLTFDANGASAGTGGSGSWNTVAPTWSAGGGFQAWNNAHLDNAVFAGSAGTVTLGVPIDACVSGNEPAMRFDHARRVAQVDAVLKVKQVVAGRTEDQATAIRDEAVVVPSQGSTSTTQVDRVAGTCRLKASIACPWHLAHTRAQAARELPDAFVMPSVPPVPAAPANTRLLLLDKAPALSSWRSPRSMVVGPL